MPVRLATAADLPAILEISNWAALNTPANFAVEPESLGDWQTAFDTTSRMYPWFVATDDDDAVIGFAKGSPWKGRCAYANAAEITVYVHPDHHRKGLGHALYDRLLTTMRDQGYHTVLGGITQPNEASVRLHESFGLTRVALFHEIGWKFDRWHDVGYWQGSLQPEGTPPRPLKPVSEV